MFFILIFWKIVPCGNSNLRPPEYQADALPIELSRLGSQCQSLKEAKKESFQIFQLFCKRHYPFNSIIYESLGKNMTSIKVKESAKIWWNNKMTLNWHKMTSFFTFGLKVRLHLSSYLIPFLIFSYCPQEWQSLIPFLFQYDNCSFL